MTKTRNATIVNRLGLPLTMTNLSSRSRRRQRRRKGMGREKFRLHISKVVKMRMRRPVMSATLMNLRFLNDVRLSELDDKFLVLTMCTWAEYRTIDLFYFLSSFTCRDDNSGYSAKS